MKADYNKLAEDIKQALGSAYKPAQDETIRGYVQASRIRDEAADRLLAQGLVVEQDGSQGQVKNIPNPLFVIWKDAATLCRYYVSELALTPKVQKSLPPDSVEALSEGEIQRAKKRSGELI